MTNYQVKNQWGNDATTWHPDGVWTLGSNNNKEVASIDIASTDNGKSYKGTVTYLGDAPIAFRANKTQGNKYAAELECHNAAESHSESQTKSHSTPTPKETLAKNLTSVDTTLKSTASKEQKSSSDKEQQNWSDNGVWTIGGRENQNVTHLKMSAGKTPGTLVGTMSYGNEAAITVNATKKA